MRGKKRGRPSKAGRRTASGRLVRDNYPEPLYVRGSPWVEQMRARYGEHYSTALGRAAMIHITLHAIGRFKERVRDCTDAEARMELSSPAVLAAISFSAPYVRLPTGQRIVINHKSIVTVLPRETWPRTLGRDSDFKHRRQT